MKKFLVIIITMLCAANLVQAQKLNLDTLAKYSKRTEQAKVFSKIASDIHLDAAQSAKFNQLSVTYTDKAIAIIRNDKAVRCDKFDLLRQTLKEYTMQIKLILSPEQFSLLKGEREKYHFGRKFVSFND